MYKIHLQEIQIFLAVAKYRNFSKAASALYLSQPTVTKWIKHLEAELDLQLLERTSKSVRLTPAGKLLAEKWTSLLEDIDSSVSEAKHLSQPQQVTLRIGALFGYNFESFVTEYVGPFEEKHPDITIDFNIYTLHELQEQTDSLDLIFSNNLEAEYLSNYTQVTLDSLPIYLALSKKHPLAKKSSITVQEIQNENFLIFPPHISSSALSHAQEAFLQYEIYPKFIPVENLSSQFLKICQNKGVCITSHYAIKGFEHDIALIKVKDFPLELNRIMAYQKRKLSKGGKAFCRYVMEQFS